MQLNPAAFNRLIAAEGQQFEWRRGHACPCVNPATGSPSPRCQTCFGFGRFWDPPVLGVAGVGSRDVMAPFAQFGNWDSGDIILSVGSDSPIYEVGMMDRVAAINRTEPFSVNVIPGANSLSRYRLQSIESAYWAMPAGVVSPLAPLPTVDATGAVVYDPAATPPAGSTVSLTGRRYPEFFVYLDIPLDRPHQSGADLPRRVLLRRFDLFGR